MMALFLVVAAQAGALVGGTVVDAALGTPVVAALLEAPSGRARSDEAGRFTLRATLGDTIRVRRIGYQPTLLVVDGVDLGIRLTPAAATLPELVIDDRVVTGRLVARREVRAMREQATLSAREALARMPFVSARSARGAVAVSMRGARPEQVLIMLDGVPLNDPATGAADAADIPLAALGSVTAVPGAGAGSGSGASGGVLSLGSSSEPGATAWAGSYGEAGASAAHRLTVASARALVGAELAVSRGDFPFVNTEGARDTAERRANNDERRAAAFVSALAPSAQLTALVSRAERGLVGPMNVRVLDDAHGTTDRVLVRAAGAPGPWDLAGAVRALRYRYHDPRGVSAGTRSRSADVEIGHGLRGMRLRVGAGADHVSGSALPAATRARGFASAERAVRRAAWRATAGLRVDAVRTAGVRASPSLAVERVARVTLFARASQAFRAPTFYDLYFAPPRAIFTRRAVEAERVTVDAELGLRIGTPTVSVAASAFERRTRDAIVWFPGTFDWSPANVPRERVRGVEGRASARTGALEVDLWGAARSVRLSALDADLPTPYVPYVDGGATAQVRRGPVGLAVIVNGIGRRPFASVPDPGPESELPAVLLADAVVSWQRRVGGTSVLVTAAARNVGGVRWEPIVRYPAPGRTWSLAITLQP